MTSETSAADRARLDFLHRAGATTVRHNSEEDLLPHLLGTRDLLRGWDARPAVCDAGLFHSIYGTEYFPTATVDPARREEMRAMIGTEAEALVWLWCFGRRTTLEDSLEGRCEPRMRDRRSAEWLPLVERQLDDLVDIWIADTLEQLPRVAEREVPTARMLLRYTDRALPAAAAALEETVERWTARG